MSNANTQQRLLLIYAATLVGTLAISWWIATSLLTSSLEQRLDDQLKSAVDELARGSLPYSENLLQRLTQLLTAEIILVGPAGQASLFTGPSDEIVGKILAAWDGSSNDPSFLDITADGVPYRAVIAPIDSTRDVRYTAVAVAAPLDDVRHAARSAAMWLAAVASFGVLFLIWVGQHIARRLTGPVRQLAQMAEQIANGDRTVRAAPNQPDELGVLATALDAMTEKLSTYETEIATQSRLAALGEISARVAHEIRNPLTALKMQLQLLAEEGGDQERFVRLLDEINRLELVVSSTLAVGRTQQLQLSRHSLDALVADVVKLLTPQLEHHGISVETRFGGVSDACLDGDKIKQILFNLIGNSLKAMPGGGKVRITTEISHPSTILMYVEDSGHGLSAEASQSLLDQPANNEPLRLGLVLSRELAEAHGGSIAVDNHSQLQGARVIVRLPWRQTVDETEQ